MNRTHPLSRSPHPSGPLTAFIGLVCAILLFLGAPMCFASGPSTLTLSNGLRIAMFPDPDMNDGTVQVWLQIRAGSVSERDEERGSAMVLKRASMFGTATMDEPEIHELFARSGMDSSIGHGSFTYFDQTTYMLSAPGNEPLDRVLTLYRDLLSDHHIDEQSFTRAREGLLGYLDQAPPNPMRRWMPEILGGVPVGNRMPLPGPDEILRLTPERVNQFAERTYTPANATLLIVGSFNTESVVEQARAFLGAIKPRGGAIMLPQGTGTAARGRITTVSNVQDGTDVALVWFEHNQFSKADPEATMHRLVLEKVAAELVRHRINAQVFRTLDGAVETDGSIVNLYSSIRAAQIVAAVETGANGSWEDTLRALLGEVNRLTQDPIGKQEFARARRACLLQWQSDQDEWSELSGFERARACNWIVNAGLSFNPAHWSDDASSVLATITDEQIHATIRRVFDPAKSNLILLSDQAPLPSTDAVRSAFHADRGIKPEPLPTNWVTTGVPPILASIPARGEIREITQHPGSGVWAARMSNGVIVRQRTMNDATRSSELRVALRRTIGDRTLEDAAISGWRSPSTTKLNADEIRSILNEHGLTLDVHPDGPTIQLVIRAGDGELDHAIELAYVLLSDAEVDAHAFERWQESAQSAADEPEGLLEIAFDAFVGKDHHQSVRCSLPGSITHAKASRALHDFVRTAPMEISIVGPDDAEETLEYAKTLFGALPDRPEPTVCSAPTEHPNTVEPECVLRVQTDEPENAGVVIGMIACDSTDLPTLRAMILSSMILNDRLSTLTGSGQLPSNASARVAFDERTPGKALLLIESPGPMPDAMGDIIDRVLADLAGTLPTEDEIRAQTTLIRRILDGQIETTRFWADRLADLGAHGYTPDDIWRIREAYLGITPKILHERFAACYARGRHIRVEVVSDEPPEHPAP